MYLVTVLLLTVLLPITSIYAEQSFANTPQSLMMLVGTWFVFWSAGVRHIVDGSLQFFQPQFTSQEIIGIHSHDALPLVRELGVTNLATGLVGVVSIIVPQFTLPAAIIGATIYGVAGVRRAKENGRTGNETVAMVSDLFVSTVLTLYCAYIALAMLIAWL